MNYTQNASVLFIYAWYRTLCFALIFTDTAMSIQVSINNQHVERTQQDFYPIVQVSPVPVDVKLSQVLWDVSPYIRDVIGVMRVADYKAKRLGETVFLYCMNLSSAKMLESIKLEYHNQFISPSIVPMKVGRASFIDKNFDRSFDGVPITIILKGIERQKDVSIYYLMELAKYFEKKGVITGLRMGYNESRNWTTSQGFVTFLRQADARASSGEGGYIQHTIQSRQVRASLSENIPMLVSHEDLDRFENGIITWGDEAEAINQLVMTYEFPMHLAERKTVNKRDFLQQLHKKYEKVNFQKYESAFTREHVHKPYKNPAKRTKLAESNASPKESDSMENDEVSIINFPPKAETSKPINVPEVRDSPESPFEDIVSDSDEEILQINLDAENAVEEVEL